MTYIAFNDILIYMNIATSKSFIGIADTHTFTVRLTQTEKDVLDALKAQGIQKGHWVAQAIREKMERDGLLDGQEEKER